MKQKISILALATLLFANMGCQNNKSETKDAVTEKQTIDIHNANNSIDWEGSYFGKLPCASCPGMNTLIHLYENGTFIKEVEYLESDSKIDSTKGKIIWSKDGTIITLGESTYLVGENQLIALDANNKVIEGVLANDYILKKTELQEEPNANDGITLVSFIGNDKIKYDIVFDTNPKIPTAIVQYNDKKISFAQKEAWAKGAEYSDGSNKNKLIIKGDKGTLILSGKKIELTEN